MRRRSLRVLLAGRQMDSGGTELGGWRKRASGPRADAVALVGARGSSVRTGGWVWMGWWWAMRCFVSADVNSYLANFEHVGVLGMFRAGYLDCARGYWGHPGKHRELERRNCRVNFLFLKCHPMMPVSEDGRCLVGPES